MKHSTILKYYKNLLTVFLALFYSSCFSQSQDSTTVKGMILSKKNSKTFHFLTENKRIKLELKDGKVVTGKFKIVNDSTISIKQEEISLNSIVRIKRRSMVSSIFSPMVAATGILYIVVGVVGIASGGYGPILAVFIPPGIPMTLLPLISENHRPEKWSYSIGAKPKLPYSF